jgi:hypothetical protein
MLSGLPLEIGVLILVAPILLFVMFLPSFHELKKPKDAGPRLLPKTISASRMLILDSNSRIANIEEPETVTPNNSGQCWLCSF